jgi:hypothetical protein
VLCCVVLCCVVLCCVVLYLYPGGHRNAAAELDTQCDVLRRLDCAHHRQGVSADCSLLLCVFHLSTFVCIALSINNNIFINLSVFE